MLLGRELAIRVRRVAAIGAPLRLEGLDDVAGGVVDMLDPVALVGPPRDVDEGRHGIDGNPELPPQAVIADLRGMAVVVHRPGHPAQTVVPHQARHPSVSGRRRRIVRRAVRQAGVGVGGQEDLRRPVVPEELRVRPAQPPQLVVEHPPAGELGVGSFRRGREGADGSARRPPDNLGEQVSAPVIVEFGLLKRRVEARHLPVVAVVRGAGHVALRVGELDHVARPVVVVPGHRVHGRIVGVAGAALQHHLPVEKVPLVVLPQDGVPRGVDRLPEVPVAVIGVRGREGDGTGAVVGGDGLRHLVVQGVVLDVESDPAVDRDRGPVVPALAPAADQVVVGVEGELLPVGEGRRQGIRRSARHGSPGRSGSGS